MTAFSHFVKKYFHFAALLATIIFILFLYLRESSEAKPVEPPSIYTQALLAALFVTTAISFAEKLGLLSHYGDKIESLEKTIKELPGNIEDKLAFGLGEIRPKFDEVSAIEKVEGGEICWLNTHFRNWEIIKPAIISSLKKGNRIKILFMDIDSNGVEERVYYSSKSESYENDFKAYRSRMFNNYDEAISLINSVESDKDCPNLLEVKYYKHSPQAPLLLVNAPISSRDGVEMIPVEGFSGFYLDDYSSQLPYISWLRQERYPDSAIVNHLYRYFVRKWEHSETRTIEEAEIASANR